MNFVIFQANFVIFQACLAQAFAGEIQCYYSCVKYWKEWDG